MMMSRRDEKESSANESNWAWYMEIVFCVVLQSVYFKTVHAQFLFFHKAQVFIAD